MKLRRKVLRRGPNPVSVRAIREDSVGDRIFFNYHVQLKGIDQFISVDDNDALTNIVLVYVENKRAGILVTEWDKTEGYVEGNIMIASVIKKFAPVDPMRIVLADLKDFCRKSQEVLSVPHRLKVTMDVDDLKQRHLFYRAGFREMSRDEEVLLLHWPNDWENWDGTVSQYTN